MGLSKFSTAPFPLTSSFNSIGSLTRYFVLGIVKLNSCSPIKPVKLEGTPSEGSAKISTSIRGLERSVIVFYQLN